jgi:hypothetical protein
MWGGWERAEDQGKVERQTAGGLAVATRIMSDGLGTIGRYLILLGIVIVLLGVLFLLAGKFPGLRIGRLPGDIYIQRDGWRFYFPLMTSILLSIILSFVLWLISRR